MGVDGAEGTNKRWESYRYMQWAAGLEGLIEEEKIAKVLIFLEREPGE